MPPRSAPASAWPRADLFPSFSLFGTIGLETSTVGSNTPNLFSSNSLFFAVGPRISWPFFNYGRLKNGVRVQDARLQQLLVGYRNTVLRATQEVEDALAGFLNAQRGNDVPAEGGHLRRAGGRDRAGQYREGASDYQRVIDAQRSLLEQQQNLATTSSSVTTNLIALYKAMGGGWEPYQGQPFVPAETETEMKQRTDWGDMLSQPRKPEQNPSPEKP